MSGIAGSKAPYDFSRTWSQSIHPCLDYVSFYIGSIVEGALDGLALAAPGLYRTGLAIPQKEMDLPNNPGGRPD